MNEHETYLFDLQGFLVVPNALTPEEVSRLNDIMDEQIERETDSQMRTHHFERLLSWDKAYRDLIDNPRITPYLERIVGSHFRLDHDYADVIRPGTGPLGTMLHGGGTPFDPVQYYHFRDGQMFNGLTVVAYNLKDVNPGDGGFAGVPGSHKSNLAFPQDWRELETAHPCVQRVTGPAGTAIIFTEALTHGTLPWTGSDERRTIFLKYSPHPLAYAAQYYDANEYEELTERQREILEAPNARYTSRK